MADYYADVIRPHRANGTLLEAVLDTQQWGLEETYNRIGAKDSSDTMQWFWPRINNNIALSDHYISNDGDNEGILISDAGAVSMTVSLTMASGATINEFSTDGTLGGNSDTALPTEKAVKTYVDAAVLAEDFWDRNSGSGYVYLKTATDFVGLGLSAPANKLHLYVDNATDVLETADKQQLLIEQDGAGDAGIGFELTGGQRWSMGIDNSLATDGFVIYDITDNRNCLTIDGAGNVGIGVATPDGKLHSHLDGAAAINFVLSNDTVTAGRYTELLFEKSNGDGPAGIRAYAVNLGVDNKSQLRFFTCSTVLSKIERMTIDEAGNVGIGVVDPDSLLEVNAGTGAAVLHLNSTNAGPTWINLTSGATVMGSIYRNGNDLAIQSYASGHLILQPTAGSVGIGTATPIQGLTIYTGAVAGGQLQLGYSSTAYWDLGRENVTTGRFMLNVKQGAGAATEVLSVLTTGNVGIGVDDPDTKLEVLYAGNQLKLSFDGTDNCTFAVDTSGALTVTPSGGSMYLVAGTVVDGGNGAVKTLYMRDYTNANGLNYLRANNGYIELVGVSNNDIYLTPGGSGDVIMSGNVGIGVADPDRKLHVETDDATNNNITYVSRFTHSTSGTATTGIGVGIEFETEDDYGDLFVASSICGCLNTDTNEVATSGHLDIYIMDSDSLTRKVRIDATGNLLLGTIDSYDSNRAINCIAIANGNVPSAHVDNQIFIGSEETSDNTSTLSLMLEQEVEVVGTFTASHKIKVIINKTAYWLQLDAV